MFSHTIFSFFFLFCWQLSGDPPLFCFCLQCISRRRRRGSRRNKINCQQDQSDRQGATSTAWMPGEGKQEQIPHSSDWGNEESLNITSARPSQSSTEITHANSQLFVLPSHPTPYCCNLSKMGEAVERCNSGQHIWRQCDDYQASCVC